MTMEITAGPVPALKDILCLPRTDITPDSLPWSSGPQNCDVRMFSRGMWALRDGIRLLLDKRKVQTAGRIWFPDYFCNEALLPLRDTSMQLSFYPVRRDLTPDWDWLEEMLAGQGRPDVLVLVHYFGFPNRIEEAEEFCKKNDIALLEDAAHLLLPVSNTGRNNVTVYSPRKLLPIPEGGLLRIPGQGTDGIEDRPPVDVIFSLKWIVRSLMKGVIVKLRIPWRGIKGISRRVSIGESGNCSGPDGLPRSAPYTLSLLHAMKDNIEAVVKRRRENYMLLSRLLGGVDNIDMPFPALPEDVCPFAFPLVISEGQESIIKRLNDDYSIPASNWPDLPPEVTAGDNGHEDALWLREHVVLLPVHQSLTKAEMEYIAGSLKAVLRERI